MSWRWPAFNPAESVRFGLRCDGFYLDRRIDADPGSTMKPPRWSPELTFTASTAVSRPGDSRSKGALACP